MKPYKDSYFRTLDSLLNIARKPGQSLSAPWWCPELTISCFLKAEPDMQYENVQGGTFLSKVLTYQQYATYVSQDMPYPIKSGIGTGSMYKYELLETGEGYPKIPEFPFALSILTISIVSLIIFYQMRFRK